MSTPSSGTRVDVLFAFAYHPDVRVRRITQALAEAGYLVRILAWDRQVTLPESEHDGTVEVRRVRVRSRLDRGWTQLLYLGRAVLRFIPYLWRDPPSVLHAVDLPMLLAAFLLAPFTRRRPLIVYDAFEIYALMESHKYPRWLLRVIGRVEQLASHAADLVITPGYGRQAYFQDRGTRSTVVANWIDPPAAPIPRAEARMRLGLPPEAVVVAYAGGLDPSRDLDPLVGHARRHPEHLVLIAGRGIQEERLRAAAEELPNLRVLGWLPDPSDLLAAADMAYYALRTDHPYAAHAAPNNLYTAIAHALPLLHRGQGEIGLLAGEHRIGRAFASDAELDAAIASLAEPAVNAAVRAELCGLQATYNWARARTALLEAYARLPSTSSSDSPNGL